MNIGKYAQWRVKKVCKHGHEFNKENTYITSKGLRQCKACNKRRCKDWYETNKHLFKGSTLNGQ